jgi:hypothetical protein
VWRVASFCRCSSRPTTFETGCTYLHTLAFRFWNLRNFIRGGFLQVLSMSSSETTLHLALHKSRPTVRLLMTHVRVSTWLTHHTFRSSLMLKVKFSRYGSKSAFGDLDFRHYEGGKVVTLTHRPSLPPGIFLVLIFRGWVDPRAHGSVGSFGKYPQRHYRGSIPRPSN